MKRKNGQNQKRRGDILLLACCLGLAVLAFGIQALTKKPGSTVVVKQEGEEIHRYPLSVDREILLETQAGYNLLVIEGGSAYIREADCPHNLCVGEGRIRRTGETLVCLPHKLTITIEGEDASAPDAYTY